jgi:hypothetical protein
MLASVIALPIALLAARLFRRQPSLSRRPSVLFGITPIINNKYWSNALQKLGYQSASFVYHVYQINAVDDFDYNAAKVFPRLGRLPGFFIWEPYLCFFWGLKNFDVFVFDFDGGFLRGTPLQFVEFPLLSLARKKIIAIPYGSDAMDLRRCADMGFKVAILQDYPLLGLNAEKIARRVEHYARWVSFTVCGGVMTDFLPRADLLRVSICGIDINEWKDRRQPEEVDALVRNRPIKIFHAPNHRNIKGTQFLIDACDELRAEGLALELIIKEGIANQEVKRLMQEVDIVASAFLTGYYELFAIEGMSMGKPVLNYWRPDLKLIYSTYSFAAECPVVDTPVAKIKDNIRMLAEDPELRAKLGSAGRRYVEKYHSHQAIGKTLDNIVRKVWYGLEDSSAPELAVNSSSAIDTSTTAKTGASISAAV